MTCGAAEELFWDGFQWVPRNRKVMTFDPMQALIDKKMEQVSGADTQKNLERVANSRTVLIDNIPLDLGLTSRELQRFFHTTLQELGFPPDKI